MIVLEGFGVGEIDSGSTIVAFGIARDLEDGETVEQAAGSATIEQMFVLDFDGTRRAPTGGEYRKYRRILKLMKTGQLHWKPLAQHRGVRVWADKRPAVRRVA